MPGKYFDMDSLPTPDEARAQMLSYVQPLTRTERIRSVNAVRRVLAEQIVAPQNSPDFRRSTMDGYAVVASDLAQASPESLVTLDVVGESLTGQATDFTISPGTAALVRTGGMVPQGADAVVQVEWTQKQGDAAITVNGRLKPGDNLIEVGEDLRQGDVVMQAGDMLRAQEVGGLLSLGIVEVQVVSKPRIAIISTGDEVVAPEQTTQPGQVRDINSFTLASLVEQAGGSARTYGVVPDDFELLVERLRYILGQGIDLVVLSAGSSVSDTDRVPDAINLLGEPGMLLHGVATRPGKPTAFGIVDGVPMLGLPGNPVSAMVQFMRMGVPMIHKLLGAEPKLPYLLPATLTGPLGSRVNREDWLPVALSQGENGLLAVPIPFKSNLIFTLVQADALVKVPRESAQLEAGAMVEVLLA